MPQLSFAARLISGLLLLMPAVSSAQQALQHTDVSLALAREAEKLADDVESALGQRWESIAAVVREAPRPLAATADVVRDRGLPDPEGGLPDGVFSRSSARRRYFAALLLGWPTEFAALTIAARLEADRLESLGAARAELPDVDQRCNLDRLARASSDRLHAFCRRLATLGTSCTETVLGRGMSEHAPNS